MYPYIRVTHSEASKRDTGRGFQETIFHDQHVYLDLCEVEMIMTAVLQPAPHKVMLKSGRELSVSEEDFNRIERAMKERQ